MSLHAKFIALQCENPDAVKGLRENVLKSLGGPGSGNFGHGLYSQHAAAAAAHHEASYRHGQAMNAPSLRSVDVNGSLGTAPSKQYDNAHARAIEASKAANALPTQGNPHDTKFAESVGKKTESSTNDHIAVAANAHSQAARWHEVQMGARKSINGPLRPARLWKQ